MFREIRRAWRLYRTDSRADTVAAVIILGVVAVPVVRAYSTYREVKGKSSRG